MAGLYLAKLIPDISKLHRILGTGTGDNGVKKKYVFKFSASCQLSDLVIFHNHFKPYFPEGKKRMVST